MKIGERRLAELWPEREEVRVTAVCMETSLINWMFMNVCNIENTAALGGKLNTYTKK